MPVFAALMYGQGGQKTDILLTGGGGIDRLCRRLQVMGAKARVYTWDQAQQIMVDVKAQPVGTRIVVGGTSLGANEAPMAATFLSGRRVDLIFGIQPSLLGRKNLVPANVTHAMCFYAPWWNFFGAVLGNYQWQLALGNRATRLEMAYSLSSHPGSNEERVQAAIATEVKKLL